jgi:CheY-like chemotaxis protein
MMQRLGVTLLRMEAHAILLVGELPEANAVDRLSGSTGTTGIRRVADLKSALAALRDPSGPMPELVVLCEPRPGLWSEADACALRSAAPLCRLVRLSGSWCEGQARSGQPPAGCPAIYWHQWLPRLAAERAALIEGRNPSWAQPLTATPEEQFLAHSSRDRRAGHAGTIAIRAETTAAAGALAAVCRGAGYVPSVERPVDSITNVAARAVLWDTWPEALRDAESIKRIRHLASGAPIVALAGFPRADDVRAALAAGIAAVVSKPYRTADLLWHLRQCLIKDPTSSSLRKDAYP